MSVQSNLQYSDPSDAADYINIVNHELNDYEIKGALINALNRIAILEKQIVALAKIAEDKS